MTIKAIVTAITPSQGADGKVYQEAVHLACQVPLACVFVLINDPADLGSFAQGGEYSIEIKPVKQTS